MPPGDAVGDRDGAEFPRRAARGGDTFLDRLRLPHESDVAGSRFVPAGRNANQGLMDFLAGEPHCVKIGAVRRARRTFGHMPAWQSRFIENPMVHGIRARSCR